jgi:flagellar basal-body rod modification protein FlgD
MSSITSAAGVGGGSVGASSGFGGMDSEEFVKIIFTELQNQDPFSPNDSSALLEQLNSIRSIESDMALTSQLESIVFQNQLAGASNLIGRYIQGMAPGGNRVDGQVISVIRQGDAIGVELDTGWVIDVDQVELIVDETLFDDGTGGTNGENPFDGSGLTDVNGDGVVDGTDLSLLLGQWSEYEQGETGSDGESDESDSTDESEGADDAGGSDDSGDSGAGG